MKVACKCKSAFQDETLGIGIRYANPINKSKKDGGKVSEARCTVCGVTHRVTPQ